MNKRESDGLEQVYAARTPAELAAAYSIWSNAYDRETLALGYCLPFMIASWVVRYAPSGDHPVLDAGCGTGLSGPYLAALGYRHIEGLDMSQDMLALAAGRDIYKELKQAELGTDLPWADAHFAAFFCTGVFTEGHAPASGLDELVRITRPGGHAIFTVRDTIMETGGFRAQIAALEQTGRWRSIEQSPPFRAFAVAEPDVMVRAFVFEVL